MVSGENERTDSSFKSLESDIREYLDTYSSDEPTTNPLAYINLSKAGRDDLIPRIMDAGGYIEVSQRLGVSVYESNFIKPPSVTQFPPLVSAQQSSSLALGQNLEKKLETVEQAIQEGKDRSLDLSATERRSSFREVPSADDLVRQNDAILPPPADEVVPEGERFTFTLPMRIGLLALVATASAGYGRSSHGVLDEDIVALCRNVVIGLGFAHLLLGIYAGLLLAPKQNRSAPLWFAKILLSGPVGVSYMRSLGTVSDD